MLHDGDINGDQVLFVYELSHDTNALIGIIFSGKISSRHVLYNQRKLLFKLTVVLCILGVVTHGFIVLEVCANGD